MNVGKQQVGLRRLRHQRRQFRERADRLVVVFRQHLYAAQRLQHGRALRQRRHGVLCGGQRGLQILVLNVVVDQQQPWRGLCRVQLDGPGHGLGHLFFARTRQGAQPCDGEQCLVVRRVDAQQALEALRRIGILALYQVDGGEAVDRRKVRRVDGHCALEALARRLHVLARHLDAPAQACRQRLGGLLAFQRLDGLQSAGHVVALEACADQRQVGCGAGVCGCDVLQFGESRTVFSARQLRQCEGRAAAHILRVHLGGAGEVGCGPRHVAGLKIGFCDQRKRIGIGRACLGCRQQNAQRLGGLARAQVGLRQQPPRRAVPGGDLQCLAQVLFRLPELPEFIFDGACKVQCARVVGCRLQQLLCHLTCSDEVALAQRQHGLEVLRLAVVRQHFLQLVELRLSGRQIVLAEVD